MVKDCREGNVQSSRYSSEEKVKQKTKVSHEFNTVMHSEPQVYIRSFIWSFTRE